MGTQPPGPKRGQLLPLFGPCLLWPNGRPSHLLLSTCIAIWNMPMPSMMCILAAISRLRLSIGISCEFAHTPTCNFGRSCGCPTCIFNCSHYVVCILESDITTKILRMQDHFIILHMADFPRAFRGLVIWNVDLMHALKCWLYVWYSTVRVPYGVRRTR